MTSASEVLVKAAPLRAALGFMKDNLDEEARARVLLKAEKEFPEEARRVGAPVIASDRFPVVFVNRLIELTAEEMKEPATDVATRIGRRGAEESSNGVMRLAMVLISIPNLLRKLGPVWGQLYTHGAMRHTAEGRTATIELEDFPVVSRTGCARITGWFEWFARQAEKTVVVTHAECRAEGARCCRWNLRW